MSKLPNHRHGISLETVPVAFGGLGFDMSSVVEKASVMTVRIAPNPEAQRQSPAFHISDFGLYGFALLTALGREIRGR